MAEKFYTLLVVDDDRRLRELLEKYLMEQGFWVITAAHAEEAREKLAAEKIDLMILDLMMPGESGLEFLKKFRQEADPNFLSLPVMMLTALGEVHNRIEGLEAGADDYLAKPFEPRELVLRIQKLLSRLNPALKSKKDQVQFGPYIYDMQREELKYNQEIVHLTSLENTLLKTFILQKGNILHREILAEKIGFPLSPRTIDVQVTRLRKKIEEDPKHPRYIQTVRHQGYIFKADE